jgi:hypothetical protein
MRQRALIPLSFFVVTAILGARLTFLHDEGVFTLDFAAALPRAFFPIFFLLKAKPLVVLLYALPAQFGARPFLVAHALVASGAIFLSIAAARNWRLPSPALAGLMLATSLGFFTSAASGFANSDGSFFLALFLYLHSSGRRTLAPLLLGALPLARYELGIVTIVFVLFERDLRFTLLAIAVPVGYFVAGAIFHHSVFALPNGIQPPDVRRYQAPGARALGRFVLTSLLVNFAALGLLGLVGWDRRNRALVPIFWAALLSYGGLVLLAALGRGFAVDLSLRYHLAPLPLVALLCASFPGARWLAVPQALAVAAVLLLTSFGREQHQNDHRLIEAVKQTSLWHGQTLYSDLQITRYDACAGVDAWMLANPSIRYEMAEILDAHRGPLLEALAAQHFLLEPGPLHHDALYLISERDHTLRATIEAEQPHAISLGRWWLYGWP